MQNLNLHVTIKFFDFNKNIIHFYYKYIKEHSISELINIKEIRNWL
jgi:hypothetical protein